MKRNKKSSVKLSEDAKIGVAVALVVALLLISANSLGLFKGKDDDAAVQATVNQSTVSSTASTQPTATTAQPTSSAQPTSAVQQASTAVSSGSDTPTAATSASSKEMSTAEIIALFNESANKVKTDASKVVKNFENRTHNQEHLVVPSVVEGMAADLIEENFKDDTEPIEYLTREDIKANYQVPGVEWASQLTEAEVASASCTDNGSEYEITLLLHPTENPEPGVGVAKAFDTITSSEVMEKAPSFVTGFSTNYTNCTVKCKIDKATGRTTWSNYTSTVILAVKLTFLGNDLDAQIGMTFEKDYTISY